MKRIGIGIIVFAVVAAAVMVFANRTSAPEEPVGLWAGEGGATGTAPTATDVPGTKCKGGEKVGPPPPNSTGPCDKCKKKPPKPIKPKTPKTPKTPTTGGGEETGKTESTPISTVDGTYTGTVDPETGSVTITLPFLLGPSCAELQQFDEHTGLEGGPWVFDGAPVTGGFGCGGASLLHQSHIEINRDGGLFWTPYDIFVVPQVNGDVLYYEPGRAGDRYVWDAIGSVFVAPAGYFDELAQLPGGGWTRTTDSGTQWTFDADGFLVEVENVYGATTQLVRNVDHQVVSVTDYAGRITTFTYQPNGYLQSATDFLGRTTTLNIGPGGELVSLELPSTDYWDYATSSPVTRPRSYTIQYVSGTSSSRDGNIDFILDDAGMPVLSMTYDSLDRVTAQVARGGDWSYSYATTTTVVDPDGVTTVYGFGPTGAIASIEVLTQSGLSNPPLRVGEPLSYLWQIQRTAACGCDFPTLITNPDGSSIAYTYDNDGNILSRTATENPGSSRPPAVETWTWSTAGKALTYTSAMGNAGAAADYTTTWTRNAQGDAISVTLPLATVNGLPTHPSMSIARSPSGLPTMVTGPDGVVTKYVWDPATHVPVSVTEDFGGLNIVHTYVSDAAGRMTSYTDPMGNTTTWTWNALDQVVEAVAPGPQATRVLVTYDNNGHVRRTELENLDASGAPVSSNPWFTTTLARNVNARLEQRTVEVDASTTSTTLYEYTPAGRLSAFVDGAGGRTEIQYDERGKTFRVTEGAGTPAAGTHVYNYDPVGSLASLENPLGDITLYESLSEGAIVSITDPLATRDEYTVDLDGRRTMLETFDSALTRVRKSEREIDPSGLVISETRHLLDGSGMTTSVVTDTFLYDAGLRLVRKTDAVGSQWTLTLDALGRLSTLADPVQGTEEFTYDANSNIVQSKRRTWNSASSAYDEVIEDATYDSHDRAVSETLRDAASTAVSTRTTAWNSRNLQESSTDALGNTSQYEWNGLGGLIESRRDLRTGGTGGGPIVSTIVATFEYDGAGRVSAAVDGAGRRTEYSRNSRGLITTETLSSGGTKSYTHDAGGRVIQATDAVGSTVAATVDPAGRVISRTVTRATGVLGTTTESMSYDALGRLILATDDDSTVQRTFDSLGRMLTETAGPNPLGSNGRTFTYGYNAVGATVSVQYPDGTVEIRGRDAAQRLSSVSISSGPTLAALQYSGGNVMRMSGQFGISMNRSLDAQGRTATLDWSNAGGSVRRFEYAHDAEHRRVMEQRVHDSGWGDVFTHDSIGRTVASRQDVVDPVAELANPGSQSAASTHTATYDHAGNRVQTTVDSGSGPVLSSYATDAANFYTTASGATHVRDADGNLVDDSTMTWKYDYLGHPVEVRLKSTGALLVSYGYDAIGRRIARTDASGTRNWVWSMNDLGAEYDAVGLVSRRHGGAGIDEVVAAWQRDVDDLDGDNSTTDHVWLTPVYDAAGDCVAVFGPAGDVVESYLYSYDGKVVIEDGAGAPITSSAIDWSQGHGGGERDAVTGHVYHRNRNYSPTVGRWTTPEPGGAWYDSGNSGNTYSWVGNRYFNGRDPFGLKEYGGVNVVVTSKWDGNGALAYNRPKYEAKGYRSPAGAAETFVDAVNMATGALDCDCECINIMVFNAHGSDWGGLRFGVGADGKVSRLSGESAKSAENQAAMAKLKKCMCPHGQVILCSCCVGGNPGLLEEMAKGIGVPVKGKTTEQAGPHPDEVNRMNEDTGEWRVVKP